MSKQSYYIFSSGELKRNNNSLGLYSDYALKKDIPIERIRDIYVFGEVTYNKRLFEDYLSSWELMELMFICLIIIIIMLAHFTLKSRKYLEIY